jgi:quinoprotein glucose dehydrogenase
MRNQCNEPNKQHANAVWTRREALKTGAALVAALQATNTGVLVGRPAHAQTGKVRGPATDWLSYGGDKASSKYSPIDQVDADNFSRLQVAWTWRSAEKEITTANPDLKSWAWESTPLMVDGVLYVSTSLSQVAAIDADTGQIRWLYDPETWKNAMPSNNGFVHRGVAYWADGDDQRILFGTGDGYLICLNALTGKPISTFGQQGRIDLTQGVGRPVDRRLYGVSSPHMICRDVVVMGSKLHDFPIEKEMPPGDVRGFDVRTGKQWRQFRSIPREGEFGNETWDEGSWKTTGSANVWTLMSADDELGHVYLPFSTPTNDWYGGQRPGDGLFGESLVCLDARTGNLALSDRARGTQPDRRPGEWDARQGRRPGEQAAAYGI